MAYGFNLGQIEGLDSSVKTVTVTLEKDDQSNTYTLTYVDNDDLWADSDNTLKDVDGNFHLLVIGITDSNLGEVYNITLSTESVEPNFKAAVEEVTADNVLTVSFQQSDLLALFMGYGSKDITTIAEISGINSNNASTYKLQAILSGNDPVDFVYIGTNMEGLPVYSTRWFKTDTDGRPTELYEIQFKLHFQAETVTLLILAARWNVTAGLLLD